MKMIKMDSLIKLAIIYAIIRPTFYIFSYHFGRISDLTVLILGVFILLFIIKKLPKISNVYFFWFITFEVLISLTFLVNSYLFELSFKDFVQMAMPAYLLVGVLLGASLVRGNVDKFNNLINIVITLSIISSIIGLIQFLFRGAAVSDFFYYLYSVPNLLEQGRPSGFMYIHYGYTAFSLLAPLFFLTKYFISKNKKYILPIIIFTGLSFLSLSTGGIIFIIITLFLYFIFYVLFSRKKFYAFLVSFRNFIKIGIPLLIFIMFLVYSFPYIYQGFQAIIDFNVENLRLGNRVQDITRVGELILKDPIHLLIGYTPLRNYPEISYIEVSFFNIIFRFGIIGLFLYYFFYFFPLFKFIKIKKFVFDRNREFFIFCIAITSIILGMIISDFTVNMSESIKFSFIMAVMLGGMISVLQKLEIEKRQIIKNHEGTN